jgi:2-polyprenyl-3-methyl-5-hydroxy-6-metoxy-1,4-benzoquinol methylase
MLGNHKRTLTAYPHLAKLLGEQLAIAPRHELFLIRRFHGTDVKQLQLCEELSAQIIKIADGELEDFLKAYDFVWDNQWREWIYFRRFNQYRVKSLSEAIDKFYSNSAFMRRYMRGLLLTQVFWSNHTAAMDFYMNRFLEGTRPGSALLEVGVGHGLLLSRAANHPSIAISVGWDFSVESLAEARRTLKLLGPTGSYELERRDIMHDSPTTRLFDAIVVSEVLEHLEEPEIALASVRRMLTRNGRVYFNIPINSPAPDHIFLWRSPEAAIGFIEQSGFRIENWLAFPATNYSMEEARRESLTVSVCVIANRANDLE